MNETSRPAHRPAEDPSAPKNAKVMGLRPSVELRERIETAARNAGLTNSAWLEQAAQEKLERDSVRDSLDTTRPLSRSIT